MRSQDPERAAEIEAMATNEEGTGLLDKLKRKEYVMANETSFRSESGIISEISINGSTTGYIEDIMINQPPSVSYDVVRVVISNAGTFSPGTTSTVKYDGYIRISTLNSVFIGGLETTSSVGTVTVTTG